MAEPSSVNPANILPESGSKSLGTNRNITGSIKQGK
jgi:hypothetical protein